MYLHRKYNKLTASFGESVVRKNNKIYLIRSWKERTLQNCNNASSGNFQEYANL